MSGATELLKKCSRCKKMKDESEFNYNFIAKDRLQAHCKKCQSECARKRQLFQKFGITEIKYKSMLKSQNNKCLICKQSETAINTHDGKIKQLSVDHCHKTGKVRGLLCNKCNLALGYTSDDIEILKKMIFYLEENQCTNFKRDPL